jgi:four helix bundle protein
MAEYSLESEMMSVAEPGGDVIRRHQQLEVFSISFETAGKIFLISKEFPPEERYSLTDQIRRSSRSVCANIAEAWRKRRYVAAFQSSLNQAEAEAAETQTWIEFARNCGYITPEVAAELSTTYDVLIGKLVYMITHPEPWILPIKRK